MSSWAVPGYTEDRELGRGASGRVVAATSHATGQRVAIKYLSDSLVADPAAMARFRWEARMLAALDVPHIVRLLGFAEEPGAGAAIVMELVDGASLHELIATRGRTGPQAALTVLKGSLLGLAAAHSVGVVHRDYKPENVLVDRDGTSKLSDFGTATRAGRQAPAEGTPLYMAPEQWAGAPASPATDIYAATAVFYECLTGRTPFTGRTGQLRQQHEFAAVPAADVDEALRPLIERGLAKDPAARPADAISFLAALHAAADAAYGPYWEEHGRSQLAERVAALLMLLTGPAGTAGGTAVSRAVTQFEEPGPVRPRTVRPRHARRGLTRRKKAAWTAGAVVVAAAVAIAATALASQTPSKPQPVDPVAVTSATVPVLTAAATATPPAAAGSCQQPTAFAYSATLTASQPGPVTYRWNYSSGQPGPSRTVRFTAAGTQRVPGGVIKTAAAGAGWAQLEVTSPVRAISSRAGYLLVCRSAARQAVNVSATASALPEAATVTCGSAPPSVTFSGTVTSSRAGPVTYYWVLGNGATTTPATLQFSAPGTMSVPSLPFTPSTDTGPSTAVIVVTRPVTAVSSTATFTLSCKQAVIKPTVGPVSPPVHTTATPGLPQFLIATTSLPAATENVAYSAAVSATGGKAPYAWSAAGLPAGLSISASTGVISGTPTAAGPATVTVSCTDSQTPAAKTASRPLTLAVGYPPLTITASTLPAATENVAYSATAATATGGEAPYSWSAAGLPAGLSISASTGVISGTPTVTGTSNGTVTVTDSETPTPQTKNAPLTLTVAYAQLRITTTSLPATYPSGRYSAAVTATGGKTPYSWSATGLPKGLSISPSTGVISGSASAAATYPVTVSVSDSETPAAAATSALTLVVYPHVVITTTAAELTSAGFDNLCEVGKSGCPLQYQVAATGGTGSYTWSVSGQPPGVSITPAGLLTDVSESPDCRTISFPVRITVIDASMPLNTAFLTYTMMYAC